MVAGGLLKDFVIHLMCAVRGVGRGAVCWPRHVRRGVGHGRGGLILVIQRGSVTCRLVLHWTEVGCETLSPVEGHRVVIKKVAGF